MNDAFTDPAEGRPSGESFGVWLRQQRELREIDLREIADRTKISVRYLRAMEQDRFDLLPGPIFARGFLREYAKYLGLDPDEAVNFYLSTRQEANEGEAEGPEVEADRSRTWGRGLGVALLGIVLLAVLTFFVFSYLERRWDRSSEPAPPFGPPVQPQEGAEAEPAASPPVGEEPSAGEVASPEARAPLEVTLDFSQDCWVEVVIDGKRRQEQRYVQGESLQLAAQESVELKTLGNAAGVSLQVNGVPYPLEARAGQVLHDVRIDLETARRLAPEGD